MATTTQIAQDTQEFVLTPEQELEIKKANKKLILANLSSLPINEAQLAELQQLKSLTIKGLADKGGYKLVDTERKRVKQIRLAIQRREKEILETPKEFIAKVKEGVSKWVDELSQIESYLDDQQSEYERLEREEKLRKQQEEEALINARVDKVEALGAVLKGQAYFVGEHSIHMNDIAEFKADEFDRWMNAATEEAEKIAKEKAKAELISKRKMELSQLGMFYNEELGVFIRAGFDSTVTEESLFFMSIEEYNQFHGDLSSFHIAEKNRADEEARIAKEKEEQLARIAQEQERERQRIQDEMIKIKRDRGNNRHISMINLGCNLIAESYYADGENALFTKEQLFEADDEAWTILFAKAEAAAKAYKEQQAIEQQKRQEEQLKRDRFINRCDQLVRMGAVKQEDSMFIEAIGSEKWKIEGIQYTETLDRINDCPDDTFGGILLSFQRVASIAYQNKLQIDALEKQEAENLRKIEAEKMLPDSDLIRSIAGKASVLKLSEEQMKSTAGIAAVIKVNQAIDLCVEQLVSLSNSLK